jgi:8-oxo-dGTP pyrophosphatase MutT (NUDIX family)
MADIRLRRPTSISFHRRAPRRLDERQAARLAAFWSEATARQPRLFDGPTVEARQVEWHRGHCRISWSETNYARYLWRRALPAGAADVNFASALYTSVLVTTADGYVVVGQMNDHTAASGRIQLPGGNLDPAERGVRPVTVADAAAVAVRELHEETGLDVDPADLRPWMIVEGGAFDDVAVVFELTPELSVEQVFAAFSTRLAACAALGEPPEFARLVAFPLGGRRIPARLASDVTGVARAEVLDPVVAAAGVEPGATICRAWPADPPATSTSTTTSRVAALAERGRNLVARDRRPEQLPASGAAGRADN